MTTKSNEIMTPEELAGFLGMGMNAVYRELNAGTIPARRIGRKWYISRTKVMEWISEKSN